MSAAVDHARRQPLGRRQRSSLARSRPQASTRTPRFLRQHHQDLHRDHDHVAAGRGHAVDRRLPVEVAARLPECRSDHVAAAAQSHQRRVRLLHASRSTTVWSLAIRYASGRRRRCSTRSRSTRTARPAPATATPTPVMCCWAWSSRRQHNGRPLGDVVRQRWFGPLGLTNAWFQDGGSPLPSDAAYGHLLRVGGSREIGDGTDYRPTASAARSPGRAARWSRRRLTWRPGQVTCTAAMCCRPGRWRR